MNREFLYAQAMPQPSNLGECGGAFRPRDTYHVWNLKLEVFPICFILCNPAKRYTALRPVTG